jgi:cell division protein FtsW
MNVLKWGKFDTIMESGGRMKRKFSFFMPKGYNKSIQIAMLVLSFFGSLMVLSANINHSSTPLSLAIVAVRQIGFIAIGYAAMVILANFWSWDFIKKHMTSIAAFTIVFLIIPLFFPSRSGAWAWIEIPVINATIQPSEFAKITMIVILAVFLGDIRSKKVTATEMTTAPLIFAVSAILIVIIFQRDLGSGVILFALAWILALIPSAPQLRKYQWIMILIFIFGILLLLFLISKPGVQFIETLGLPEYMVNRFKAMADPFADTRNIGYQLYNSLVAFVKGNWIGVGFGNSIQKFGYLPVAQSDYILAIIVEEIGFLGFMIVFTGYAVLIGHLVIHSLSIRSERGKMVLFGTALYLLLHFILNVGGVTSLIPLTGVPLLLISAGGSSQMAIMMALGICQHIIANEKTMVARGEEQ